MFALVDIILLCLTLFLGYKIFIVLGKRTGQEKNQKSHIIDIEMETSVESLESWVKTHSRQNPDVLEGLRKIQSKDKGFDVSNFLSGADKAFELILKAFLQGEMSLLKKMTSKKVFAAFEGFVKNRQAQKHEAELVFFRLIRSQIVATKATAIKGKITVLFESEQTLIVRDAKDKIIEGNLDFVDHVTDIWVFERDLNSRDPNWVLSEITEEEDA